MKLILHFSIYTDQALSQANDVTTWLNTNKHMLLIEYVVDGYKMSTAVRLIQLFLTYCYWVWVMVWASACPWAGMKPRFELDEGQNINKKSL